MPHYKIIDYKHPTPGELARLILKYANVGYEDVQYEKQEDIIAAEEDAPLGVLPILEVDGEVVAQQQGICRYLAREHGLIGKTNKEAVYCDMIMEGLGQMFSKISSESFSKLVPEEKMLIIQTTMREDVPRFLEIFEKLLSKKESEGSQYFVGNELTWCDLGVVLTFATIKNRNPTLLDEYPQLLAYVNRVSNLTAVHEFLKSRSAI